MNEYLKDIIIDIDNPTYFQRLVSPFDNIQITPLSNEMATYAYACQSKMKLEQYQLEIQYTVKALHAIYKKVLTAIDHIDYHPSGTTKYDKNKKK